MLSRDPASREADLFARLPSVLRRAMEAPAYAEQLRGVDPSVTSRGKSSRAASTPIRPSAPPILA